VVDSDTVRWQIQAPSVEHLNPVNLAIEAEAFSGAEKEVSTDTLVILRAEKRPILQLEPGIQEAGAQDGTVSVTQIFTLVARLHNTGRAFLKDTAKVKIDISKTSLKFVDQNTNATQFVVFEAGTYLEEVT
jgi:hypothetical protein